MKNLLKVLFVALLVLTNISCTDSSQNATTSDANEQIKGTVNELQQPFLECKMDGVLIKAILPGVMIIYNKEKKEGNIWGKTTEGIISIIMDEVEGPGTYTIKGNSKSGAGIIINKDMYEVKKTGTPFTVTIEAFQELNVSDAKGGKGMKGTFKGTLMNQDGKIVKITEGRFRTQ